MGLGNWDHTQLDAIRSRHLLVVGSPLGNLNVFSKALNLQGQPNVILCEKDGPTFQGLHRVIVKRNLRSPVDDWTNDDKAASKDAYKNDLDAVGHLSAMAQIQEKTLVAQVDPAWLSNPCAAGWADRNLDPDPVKEKDHWDAFDIRVNVQYASDNAIYIMNPATLEMIPVQYDNTNLAANSDLLDDPFGQWARPHVPHNPWNQTVLPDEYLRCWRMVFVIADPVKAFPAAYREYHEALRGGHIGPDMLEPLYKLGANMRWMESLRTWCSDQLLLGFDPPIVVDVGDLQDPQSGIARRICGVLGLDTGVIPGKPMDGMQMEQDQAVVSENIDINPFLSGVMTPLDTLPVGITEGTHTAEDQTTVSDINPFNPASVSFFQPAGITSRDALPFGIMDGLNGAEGQAGIPLEIDFNADLFSGTASTLDSTNAIHRMEYQAAMSENINIPPADVYSDAFPSSLMVTLDTLLNGMPDGIRIADDEATVSESVDTLPLQSDAMFSPDTLPHGVFDENQMADSLPAAWENTNFRTLPPDGISFFVTLADGILDENQMTENQIPVWENANFNLFPADGILSFDTLPHGIFDELEIPWDQPPLWANTNFNPFPSDTEPSFDDPIVEHKKDWEREFGEGAAKMIEDLVRTWVPTYQAMKMYALT